MTEERLQTVMRRKAEAGRPASDGSPITAERAIVQAISKVAQDMFQLPAQVMNVTEGRRTLADLPEAIEPFSLIAIIEGPEESMGIVALPPETLSVLIEVQTTGNLAKGPGQPRKPTRIDASMVADFIDATLGLIEETLVETEAVVWAGGFRYASYLDDPRPLGLLLEDMGYRLWQLEVGFGHGFERKGQIVWAVPVNGRGHSLRRMPGLAEAGPITPDREAAEWAHRMENSVMGAQAQLDAVLHRVTLPLAAVMGLRAGMDIPIPSDALENLTVEGVGRRKLSAARLGQHRGLRAVRLVEHEEVDLQAPPEPKSRRVVPPPFEAGSSPFAGKSAPGGPRAPLDRIDSPAYDPEPGSGLGGLGGLGGFDGGDLGGLGGFDAGGDLPPLGLTLDGFGADDTAGDLPPLKIGSGF
ncbi:flagellar motor switch protein FliM [Rhodobacter viridis]|uniref:Flagellar motor switch protein FliM n=1 Tax=Rhodobacter viridis TaxID=1054202 RepID=A0A318TVC8_9RHOB|nr:FliM/FliN family flagellar motor C-terminal domain-containing protein [Rhodobacter viridis]PYF08614.1 flagellar motor switch protein FliM [Rhodobacter viridis]